MYYSRGINMIAKPVISPDFTIEDIHKLREYNYFLTKDMSPQERQDYYNKRGMEVHRQIQERIELWKISASIQPLASDGNYCNIYSSHNFIHI